MNFNAFGILFVIMGVVAVAGFVFALLFIFNPKIRGKMMSKGVKATKYMMEESKNDIKSISSDIAEATSDGIETTTRAIKKGLTKDESIFCKHCGAKIDKDSKFCNKCGKEL